MRSNLSTGTVILLKDWTIFSQSLIIAEIPIQRSCAEFHGGRIYGIEGALAVAKCGAEQAAARARIGSINWAPQFLHSIPFLNLLPREIAVRWS